MSPGPGRSHSAVVGVRGLRMIKRVETDEYLNEPSF